MNEKNWELNVWLDFSKWAQLVTIVVSYINTKPRSRGEGEAG